MVNFDIFCTAEFIYFILISCLFAKIVIQFESIMLAINILRYWFIKPPFRDPQYLDHDPLKSVSINSLLQPNSGPQFENSKQWSKIPHYYGGSDPFQRTIVEVERDMALGKDMILVEPEIAGQVYFHYIAHGWFLQENTMFYGGIAALFSYFFPKLWYIYVPSSFLAMLHSYMYFHVYKNDRLSQYQVYDDDRHPVSNLITAWVLGQRPDHYGYVLKKERVAKWEILSEVTLYTSIYSSLKSLAIIETYVIGDGKILLSPSPESLSEELLFPAYKAGYFRPPDLVRVSARFMMPTDIPFVKGWFDIPSIRFYPKRVRADLAILICGLGAYFMYKAYAHFCGGDESITEREWLRTEEDRKEMTNLRSPEPTGDNENNVGATAVSKRTKEQEEITRITSQVPYGWKHPGYPDNHYGIFT